MGGLTKAKNKAQQIGEMIALNVDYLQEILGRGAESHYSVYNYRANPHKEATKCAIHNQIVTLRNMLLELDKAVSNIHSTY